jgi:hypothetical protein
MEELEEKQVQHLVQDHACSEETGCSAAIQLRD